MCTYSIVTIEWVILVSIRGVQSKRVTIDTHIGELRAKFLILNQHQFSHCNDVIYYTLHLHCAHNKYRVPQCQLWVIATGSLSLWPIFLKPKSIVIWDVDTWNLPSNDKELQPVATTHDRPSSVFNYFHTRNIGNIIMRACYLPNHSIKL